MKELFNSVIRKKVRILIKTLGDGVNELVISLPLSIAEFDSIECDKDTKKYIYIFLVKTWNILRILMIYQMMIR